MTEWLDLPYCCSEVISDGPLSGGDVYGSGAKSCCGMLARTVGQMFPEPLFDGRFRLLQQRLVERASPQGDGGASAADRLLDGIILILIRPVGRTNGVRGGGNCINWTLTSFAAAVWFTGQYRRYLAAL